MATARSRVGFEYAGFVFPLCAFLGLPGTGLPAWVFFQTLLSATSSVLILATGRRLWNQTAAVAASVSYGVLWDALQWDVYVLSDSLFMFTLCLTLWAFALQLTQPTPGHRAAAWGCAAWLALSRPVGIPLLAGWILFDSMARPRGARLGLIRRPPLAIAFCGVLLLAVAFASSRSDWAGTDVYPVWYSGTLVWQDPTFRYPLELRPADDWVGLALRNPHHLFLMGILKALLLFLPVAPRFSLLHNAANALTFVPLMLLAAPGGFRLFRANPRLAGLLATPMAILVAIVAATFVDYDWRYRAPLTPLLSLLAGYEVGRNAWLRRRLEGLRLAFGNRGKGTPSSGRSEPNPFTRTKA